MSAKQSWDAELYQSRHSFVWEHGHDLLPLLAPAPGERILDLGCGSGQLTAAIVKTGASVFAVDRSPPMAAQARRNYPKLRLALANATALPFRGEFDAVFSNAVLHWVKDMGTAAAEIAAAPRAGGRLVAEFGGKGNIRRLLDALFPVLRDIGIDRPEQLCPFPQRGGVRECA